jgi:hypothetical protein
MLNFFGNKIGMEVPLVAEVAIPPPPSKKVVSIPQDDSGSDSEGSSSDDLGSGSDNGKGEDRAMHIPFRMTPSGVMWYKCPISGRSMILSPRWCFRP